VVICLERAADCLHMVQLMPLPSQNASTLASFKSRLVLPFWYRLTQVVLKKRPLNGRSSGSSRYRVVCAGGAEVTLRASQSSSAAASSSSVRRRSTGASTTSSDSTTLVASHYGTLPHHRVAPPPDQRDRCCRCHNLRPTQPPDHNGDTSV